MTGEAGDRAGRRRDWAVAVLAAAAVLIPTVAAVRWVDQSDRKEAAHEAEEAAGVVASGVAVDLGSGLSGVSQSARYVLELGADAVAAPPASIAPGATAVGLVPGPAGVPESWGDPLLSEEELAQPEVAQTLDRARDTAKAQLSGPVTVADGERALLVTAVYQRVAAPRPPTTATEARQRLVGWVVGEVDVDALAASHTPDGASVRVADSSTADLPRARADESTEEQIVDIADRRLLVEADVQDDDGVPMPAVVLVALGVVLAAAVAAALLMARRRERSAERIAEDRAAQVRLIGEVAPLVQQSLELAEVLPSVAVQLSDHFELAGIALSTGSTRGSQTELFSLGAEPDHSIKPALQPPDHLAAGATLRLALQRGGRSVALLQVVAGRALDAEELESLRALSELITAALVNAQLYASQQEALGRLRDLDALKTVFLGTASHELRTPATAIAGFAGLLTSSWDRFTEEQRLDFVRRIAANARSLSTVVQDLLDFSLLDRGTLSVSLVRLDVGEVVSGVVDRLGPAFAEHSVEHEIEPTPPVEGDRGGLERVTTNLLTNAVKFSPPGTTIRVAVRPADRDVVIEVCDQGPGVPAEERERVFARFYRGSGDAVLQTRGVGIGLSVVSEFVARMRGSVAVDDAPGGGARFTVRLPVATADVLEEIADATTA